MFFVHLYLQKRITRSYNSFIEIPINFFTKHFQANFINAKKTKKLRISKDLKRINLKSSSLSLPSKKVTDFSTLFRALPIKIKYKTAFQNPNFLEKRIIYYQATTKTKPCEGNNKEEVKSNQ